jgi:glycosyltransferase involved in cell wall biosynthesis
LASQGEPDPRVDDKLSSARCFVSRWAEADGGVRKRIIYVQYTNPAGYPPLEHSSLILARQGWEVLFLGVESSGTRSFVFPEHPRVRVRTLPAASRGWLQKLHYLGFCLWVWWTVLLRRPDWIYASDSLTAPAAYVCGLLGWRVIYHEHDSPGAESLGTSMGRWVAAARVRLSRLAATCVFPNEERARVFAGEAKLARISLVWNCPRRDEVQANRPDASRIRILYHGSVNPQRLPLAVVDALGALPDNVILRIVGYETISSVGYVEKIRERAAALGLGSERVEILPPVSRRDLMRLCPEAQIGIGFLPRVSKDINMTAMFGASNKVFDYMACGLALIVSDQPDWAGPLVASGTAVACDPEDPASIAGAVRALIQDPEQLRRRGEQGRQLILDRWNYEAQFQPVLEILEKTA